MDNMEMENAMWKNELASSEEKMQTAIGDALIAAASICYFGPLDSDNRANLLADWLARCEMGNFNSKCSCSLRKSVSRTTKLDLLLKPAVDSKLSGKSSETLRLDQNQNRKTVASTKDGSLSNILEAVVPTRDDFCLEDILSCFEEQCDWRLKHMPTDLHAVQNALIMRACCQNRYHVWPLLIDPDRQGKKWVKILQKGESRIREHDLAPVSLPPSAAQSRTLMSDKTVEDEDLVPPSRGTAISITDVSDYSLAESVSLTESSSHVKR
jgi:dynein heavy chain